MISRGLSQIKSVELSALTSNQCNRGCQTMEIKDFLSPDCVMVDVRAPDKAALLQELARRAGAALDVAAGRISAELLRREELGSTGTGGGVAIPHARIAEVKKPFGMLVRLRQAIKFDAIDDQPVDIVFVLLLPAAPVGEQLTALASVARKLRDPVALRRLRNAADGNALYRVMSH
jgi:PTS system nitrogen regulatory IIA component